MLNAGAKIEWLFLVDRGGTTEIWKEAEKRLGTKTEAHLCRRLASGLDHKGQF